MFTKYDANGNAVFNYSEEVNGWFYDVVFGVDTYPLVIAEDEKSFTCYSDYSGSIRVDQFEIA